MVFKKGRLSRFYLVLSLNLTHWPKNNIFTLGLVKNTHINKEQKEETKNDAGAQNGSPMPSL